MSTEEPTSDNTAIEHTELVLEGQTVLILCGLIASGKSTFAEALQLHYPQFRRCNQDELGDRRRVEQLARSSLAQGLSVCIDRTNFNPSQRSYWIEIAREFPGTTIWVIVFDTPYETCAARLRTRENHPTITNADEGLTILARFAADFQAPTADEGYHRILYVKPEDQLSPKYSRPDISVILRGVRDSAPVAEAYRSYLNQRSQGFNTFRGNLNRGYRGQRGGYASRSSHFSPRGRGGSSSAGPYSNGFRGWQSTSHPGSNVGAREGTGMPPQ